MLHRSDIPTLWLRVDPDHAWIRQVTIEQPDTVWCMMLKYERDPNAQIMVCCVSCTIILLCILASLLYKLLMIFAKLPGPADQLCLVF